MNKPARKYNPKPTEHILVGMVDVERRKNLFTNIVSGVGKATQQGPDIKYVVGSEKFGYIEYLIKDTLLPNEQQTKTLHGK